MPKKPLTLGNLIASIWRGDTKPDVLEDAAWLYSRKMLIRVGMVLAACLAMFLARLTVHAIRWLFGDPTAFK